MAALACGGCQRLAAQPNRPQLQVELQAAIFIMRVFFGVAVQVDPHSRPGVFKLQAHRRPRLPRNELRVSPCRPCMVLLTKIIMLRTQNDGQWSVGNIILIYSHEIKTAYNTLYNILYILLILVMKKLIPAKFCHNTRYREVILPPAEDRIKDDIVWRLSSFDEWKERRLILCTQHLFVGMDEMNVITELINLVTRTDITEMKSTVFPSELIVTHPWILG